MSCFSTSPSSTPLVSRLVDASDPPVCEVLVLPPMLNREGARSSRPFLFLSRVHAFAEDSNPISSRPSQLKREKVQGESARGAPNQQTAHLGTMDRGVPEALPGLGLIEYLLWISIRLRKATKVPLNTVTYLQQMIETLVHGQPELT